MNADWLIGISKKHMLLIPGKSLVSNIKHIGGNWCGTHTGAEANLRKINEVQVGLRDAYTDNNFDIYFNLNVDSRDFRCPTHLHKIPVQNYTL